MADEPLHILGGGPAGLAVAYHAAERGIKTRVWEAGARTGGNCRTLSMADLVADDMALDGAATGVRLRDFLFDTGAHRWHDKDAESTRTVRALLGGDLLEVEAPSQICLDGKRVAFPLNGADLLRQLDTATLGRVVWENLRRVDAVDDSFGAGAVAQYGPTLARLFLLNYSEKLWGADPFELEKEVAGGRLQNLDLGAFVRQTLLGRRAATRHLDGSFLYPRLGIGMIPQRLAAAVGADRISCNSRITHLYHAGGRIRAIEVNGRRLEVGRVVNTLPLGLSCRLLDPAPPPEITALAASIRYRQLLLGVFAIDRPSFSPNASLYFPDSGVPFTRIYESKNRSASMAPEGQTAIVVEVPCFADEPLWRADAESVRRALWPEVRRVGALDESAALAFGVCRLPFAYPVLERGYAAKTERLVGFMAAFGNMRLSGRSALFRYTHLHDLLRDGRELAAAM